MTLILNCLTPQYAIQVSDRRLVLPTGALLDDHTNKSILVNGNVVFSYTGLAYIDGKTRNDDWLLDALSDIHRQHPDVALTTVASEDYLRPLYMIISNTHSENGKWLAEALPRFSVLPFTPPEGKAVMLVADGQPLGADLRKRLLRQIHSCVHKGAGPKPIARLLVAAARTVAATNSKVGRNLLVNCIPRDSVQNGALRLFGATPNRTAATFTYIPENTLEPVQYAPHVFAYGISCKEMTVLQEREAS